MNDVYIEDDLFGSIDAFPHERALADPVCESETLENVDDVVEPSPLDAWSEFGSEKKGNRKVKLPRSLVASSRLRTKSCLAHRSSRKRPVSSARLLSPRRYGALGSCLNKRAAFALGSVLFRIIRNTSCSASNLKAVFWERTLVGI